MFILIVVILTLIYVIVFDEISSLIAALFSSNTTLPVPYNNNSGYSYNGPLVALNIKLNVYNLDDYNFGAYNLPL